MHDRPMFAGTDDGGEGFAVELRRLGAEGQQPGRPAVSVSPPCGAWAANQARKRIIATASRRWAARAPACSAAVLQARGRTVGSSPPVTLAPAARSRGRDGGRGTVGVAAHAAAGELVEGRQQRRARGDRHLRAKMRPHGGAEFCRIGEQGHAAIRPQHGHGQTNGGVGEIPPRRLSSHATACGSARTAASSCAAARAAAASARFSAADRPAKDRDGGRPGRRAAAAGLARQRPPDWPAAGPG